MKNEIHAAIAPTNGREFDQLSHQIIGAAIHVHKELGPGFVESVYHNALCITLDKRGIQDLISDCHRLLGRDIG